MTTTPLPQALALALNCGAARFYPEAQSERDDPYLVGQQFIERFYAAARADLEAEVARLREALQNMLGAFDTPIQRRRLGRSSIADKAIESARAALEMKP